MKARSFTIPEVALIGGTRAALGAGLALLLSGQLNKDQRRAAGWALFAVGFLSSIPILAGVMGKRPLAEEPVGLPVR
jgi:hypothetical protein